jgi:Zn-finger protein
MWNKTKIRIKKRTGVVPCGECRSNSWKTKVKGQSWECRKCGTVRGKSIE